MKNKYGTQSVAYHSSGDAGGISRALIIIANELAEMNRLKQKEMDAKQNNEVKK